MRMPLSAKILGCFFLNLLLLGLAALAFVRLQNLGFNSFIAAQARDRVGALAHLVEDDLRSTPPERWNAALARFAQAYDVQLTVFAAPGKQLAGLPVDLPPEVLRALPAGRPRGERLRGGIGPLPPPPPREPAEFPPRDDRLPILVQAGNPAKYWMLVPLHLGEEFSRGPLSMIISSETLRAGGLLFDTRPWALAAAFILITSALFWLPLVRGMTRDLSRMTAATSEIAGGDFSARAPESRRDEIGILGRSINQMAARLHGFVQGQKRFLGDTAHELVSPLARMEMGLSILRTNASLEHREPLREIHEEVRLMSQLVDELLSFSKASLHRASREMQPISVAELVAKTIKREALTEVELAVPADLQMFGDFDLLQRALGNVLRNATHHAPGKVEVSARRVADQVELTVADRGPGIPESTLAQVFDPFFRVDTSRDRETGGTGLGLAITKTCVEACGGSVCCSNRVPHGLAVVLTLGAA